MSYGVDYGDLGRRAADMAGKSNEIPVVRTTKFELAINLKTAKRLASRQTPELLAVAEEVIE
jgi:putative tryptophan/tyrosine transport system substrate-binding protein